MKSLIYYNKKKMETFKPVFEKIKECRSCNMNSKDFAMNSNIVIREPMDDTERELNGYQKEAFELGYNRVIYSFII